MKTQAPGTEMADAGEEPAAAQEGSPQRVGRLSGIFFLPRNPENCLVVFLVDLWLYTTVSRL